MTDAPEHRAEPLPSDKYIPAAARLWLYRVAVALLPILIVTGVVTADLGGYLLVAVAAVLGIGVNTLAAANTPR
jgi:hypothetical protein